MLNHMLIFMPKTTMVLKSFFVKNNADERESSAIIKGRTILLIESVYELWYSEKLF